MSKREARKDPYGFQIPSNGPTDEILITAAKSYGSIRKKQRQEWNDFITEKPTYFLNFNTKQSADLKRLVRRGIPHERRREIWQVVSGSAVRMKKYPGYYDDLLKRSANKSTKHIEQIKKDVGRTFPGHPTFESNEGKESLQRVLTAYSFHEPKVGYTQSMNFVAGFMLNFMPEEEAFWLLDVVISTLLPPDYYSSSMSAAQADQLVFEDLLQLKRPRLKEHLEKNGITLPMITTSWFLSLFVNVLPTESILRIWDIFFSEGSKALFRFAIALFKYHEEDLLRAKDDYEILTTLQKMTIWTTDPEKLVNSATKGMGSFPMKKIAKLRGYHLPRVYQEAAAVAKERSKRKKAAAAAAAAAKASTSPSSSSKFGTYVVYDDSDEDEADAVDAAQLEVLVTAIRTGSGKSITTVSSGSSSKSTNGGSSRKKKGGGGSSRRSKRKGEVENLNQINDEITAQTTTTSLSSDVNSSHITSFRVKLG